MRFNSRNAGAPARNALGKARWLALPLCFGLALPATAADLRLLQVRPAQVREAAMAQSAQRTGSDTASLRVQVQVEGEQHVLMLRVNDSLGAWAAGLRPRSVAFEGYLPNLTGSWVRVTRTGTRWAGMWFDGANYYGIDSARAVARTNADAAAAAPDSLVVFRLADAVMDGPVFMDDTLRPALTAEALADQVSAELQAPATAAALVATRRLTIGMIADAELVARDGADTQSKMLERLNIVNGIFSSQLGVRIQAGTPTLLDAATQASIPLSSTAAGTLLDKLATYRGSPGSVGFATQQATGLSHLMTGRDLDGQTVGIAYLSDLTKGVALCNRSYSASLSEARRGVTVDAWIAAHEIGHVFGAPHDGETDATANQACAAEPLSFLMSATLNSSQTFSNCSLAQIAPVVEATNSLCLAPIEADLSVAASSDAANVTTGSDIDATFTVRNLGNTDTTDAQLNITVPAGLTLVTVTATGISCAQSGAAVSCAPSALAVNATANVRLTLRGTTAGAAAMSATVSSTVTDPVSTNNQAQVSITVNSVSQPPPPASSSKSGGGKAGAELLLALLLLAQRLWTARGPGRQPDAVAK
jgi:uncharacterized repeat protein (TIGR01451 family)